MAQVAQEKLAQGTSETGFYQAKLHTARFYYQRLLPRTLTHKACIESGVDNLLALAEEDFGTV